MAIPHVMIVGGGFGGLAAARVLAGADVRITLVDRHNYHLFQPLLYQVATASLSPADIASPIRWILRKQRNVQVLLAAARSIDPIERTVTLDVDDAERPAQAGCQEDSTWRRPSSGPQELHYDYLIVATGAAHAYF